MNRKNINIYLLIFLLLSIASIFYYLLKKEMNNNAYTESDFDIKNLSVVAEPSKMPTVSITVTPIPSPIPTPDIFSGHTKQNFYVTYYGWPDNDPPGNAIAYPKNRYSNTLHDTAAGIGTYANPITFASDSEHITIGKIYYVIYLRKYIVMEDLCVGCVNSWNASEKHIDIWIESSPNFKDELFACQRKLTRRNVEVIIDPSSTFPVDTTPLFNQQTGKCNI